MIAPPKIKALINPEAELSSALSRSFTASEKILGNIIELNKPIEMIVQSPMLPPVKVVVRSSIAAARAKIASVRAAFPRPSVIMIKLTTAAPVKVAPIAQFQSVTNEPETNAKIRTGMT